MSSKFKKKHKIIAFSGITVLLALIIGISAAAWFAYQRKLGDLQLVQKPKDLYITAGNGDEMEYFDMSGIKVAGKDENGDERIHKYFVFGVKGTDSRKYNLQLAYTTNNQFDYYIYPAVETENQAEALVEYVSKTGEVVYYKIDPENPNRLDTGVSVRGEGITTRFLNRDGEPIIANQAKHNQTYETDEGGHYDNVQSYAEPLYWQALGIRSNINALTREIEDFYILEVNWQKTKEEIGADNIEDNRETDILYIAVEAVIDN